MKKRRKKKRRYKIKNILMLVIIIFLIVKLFSVLINSGKDNKDEVVKKSEPKTYLNKVSKTDNYNDDIDKDIQNTIVKYMDSYFKSITTLKEVDMTNLFCNDAYEEAMKDYNYEKIQYDKTQEEINLKTSIVQQQDKNLELKLTRLDNERNAVNTEIEAVKKVVSDNIEKSYKTFSG